MAVPVKTYMTFSPRRSGGLNSQLVDVLSQLLDKLYSMQLDENNVVMLTVFIREIDGYDYVKQKYKLLEYIWDFFGINNPPTIFVSQPPVSGDLLLETLVIDDKNHQNINIRPLRFYNIDCVIVEYFDYKEIYVSGFESKLPSGSDTGLCADMAFSRIRDFLLFYDFGFPNIVRQWNYIEKITEITNYERISIQNYQAFNNVRTAYYNTAEWHNGYPAATGIGVKSGGVALSFIAVKGEGAKLMPLRNPVQIDAHKYSENVLIGDSEKEHSKTSPKFERAKIVLTKQFCEIYVSGTAAIRGERTLEPNNIEKQTYATIENIFELVSKKNLEEHNCNLPISEAPFSYFRAYIKNRKDAKIVKEICDKAFGDIPASYVIADICREDLLVEIEAYKYLPFE